MPRKKINLVPGAQFGRLTVLEVVRLSNTPARVRHGFKDGAPGARCLCDCGRETRVSGFALVSGNTRSCGCLRTEIATARIPAMNEATRMRGRRSSQKHPLYGTWRGMMTRCYDRRHTWYQRYGGRGIEVWQPWHVMAVFGADIERYLGPRPSGMTLDRIDNDGNYEPGNVRWATRSQQMRNRQPKPLRFSPEQVTEMRGRRAAGETLETLAAEHGCSVTTIWRWTKD
jgi:hypothetical protein